MTSAKERLPKDDKAKQADTPESQRYQITLELLEDLHSGTGMGNKEIDALQLSDRNGRAVIRATHFKGVLRDSGTGYVDQNKLDSLFGKKNKGKKKLLMTSLRPMSKPETLIWTNTAFQEFSRIPLEDTLRSKEYVPAGTKFTAEFELSDPSLLETLKICLKRTTNLGSLRTRGSGLIKIEPLEVSPQNIRTIETILKSEDSSNIKPVLRIVLRNIEPLCLPTTGYPGNIIQSDRYIRGQTLLGSLAGWAIEQGKIPTVLFERKASIGNALPISLKFNKDMNFNEIDKWDVMPLPLHIYSRKPGVSKSDNTQHSRISIPWWAEAKKSNSLSERIDEFNRSDIDRQNDKEKTKRPKDGEFIFRSSSQNTWEIFKPVMGVHMRNAVFRKDQIDALFSEEEIAEDTLFMADIDFTDFESADSFNKMSSNVLSGASWLSIGRGGRPVEILACKWINREQTSLNPNNNGINEDSFTITLESDLIARGDNLGFHEVLTPKLLGELIGLIGDNAIKSEQSINFCEDNKECETNKENKSQNQPANFCETTRITGFNAASGLPRPPVLAIKAGSALKIKGDDAKVLFTLLKESLNRRSWLGERTHEGFGRFRLNYNPKLDDEQIGKAADTNKQAAVKNDYQTKEKKQTYIAKNEDLIKKAYELSKELEGKDGIFPGKSQLQAFRLNILSIKNPGDIDKISPEDIDKVFEELKKHASKLGGVKWEKINIEKLQEITKKRNAPKEAVQMLDMMIRWRLTKI